jgi:hypothetical protein
MPDSEDKIEPEEIEQIFAGLPVTLNVGFPSSLGGPGRDTTIIGWSNAYRNKDDGRTTIVISLDPEASEKLKDLAQVFDIKAIGFAGIKKEPQDGR